jgi:4-oxalocrotonate tautomerase
VPLVRIDVPVDIAPAQRAGIGDIVYQAMTETINVPDGDKFQIITAHDADGLRIDPSYLDVDRSSSAFIISITLNVGRTTEQKKLFYADVTHRLETQLGIRPQDVMIVLTEVAKENWSFGNGEAQYA